jgi:iron complex outermembrane receptor protein
MRSLAWSTSSSKKQSQGYNINAKIGDTERGGGGNKRVQFSGTVNVDQLQSLFSLEYSEREPLRATQRDFMDTAAHLALRYTARISRPGAISI